MERRTFLVLGAAAVGLAGCTSDTSGPGLPSPPAESSAPSDPDRQLRDQVAASEVALIAAYRSAIRADPQLAADLAPFASQHRAHLDRIAPGYPTGGDAAGGSGAAASGSPTAVGSESAPAPASPFPGSASQSDGPTDAPSGGAPATSEASGSTVLAELAKAESAAQAQRAAACDGAQGPGLARELCLIAASEAQHATALQILAAREAGS